MTLEQVKAIKVYHIIGVWRSGTTLLEGILDSHPNIIAPLESTFVINLYKKYFPVKNWNEKLILEFYNDLFSKKVSFILWEIEDKEKLKNDLLGLLKFNTEIKYSDLCKTVLLQYKSPNKKNEIQLIVDKNPIYSFFGEELISIYPETKFIFLVRDYRDNIVSRKKYRFHIIQHTSIYAQWWNVMNEKVLALKEKYPDKVLLVRYEDLVEKCEDTSTKIFSFLGNKKLAFDFTKKEIYDEKEINRRIDYFQKKINNYENNFQKALKEATLNLKNPINTSKIDVWKNDMTIEDIKLSEHICGQMGKDFGYKKSLLKNDSFKLKTIKIFSKIIVICSTKLFIKKLLG